MDAFKSVALAHVLVGKPVSIPDHVRDKLFRDMR
jgi:hypothetical protein